jgi:hypothetical protein
VQEVLHRCLLFVSTSYSSCAAGGGHGVASAAGEPAGCAAGGAAATLGSQRACDGASTRAGRGSSDSGQEPRAAVAGTLSISLSLSLSGLSERVTALAQGPDAALATVAKSLVQQWLVRKPTRGRRERREAACNEAAPRASRCRAS